MAAPRATKTTEPEQAEDKPAPPADEGHPNIHVAIARVAADIGHIAKANRVSGGGANFNFRGIDDVLDTIHTPLADHGVSIIPTGFDVIEQSERVTQKGTPQVHLIGLVRYRIIGPLGDYVDAAVVAEALDTSDKAASKMMSMAYKYLAFQTFSIPVRGALEESDREQLERGRPDTSPRVTIEDVHNRLTMLAQQLGTDMESLTGKFREQAGNLTMEQFMALPVEKVYPFAQQVSQYAARQAAASESREEPSKA